MRIAYPVSALLLATLLGCGAGNVDIDISPKEATVIAGQTFQFTASVKDAGNKEVIWVADRGAVSIRGLYQAPAEGGLDRVIAVSQADPARGDVATVTVLPAVTITPYNPIITPNGAIAFTAVVTGTADTSVLWSVEEADGGTIDASGLYTAPGNLGTYHVIATSVADPTKTSKVTVMVG